MLKTDFFAGIYEIIDTVDTLYNNTTNSDYLTYSRQPKHLNTIFFVV